MSEQPGYSPSFKRPSEIMRMRRKRIRSEAEACSSSTSGRSPTSVPGQSGSSPASVRPFSPGPLFNTQSCSGRGIKRRNPFANIENTCSPEHKVGVLSGYDKSKNTEGEEETSTRKESEGVLSFSQMLMETERQEKHDSGKKCLMFPDDEHLLEKEEKDDKIPLLKTGILCQSSSPADVPASVGLSSCTDYPADWSLKTRLLITSPLSLSWAEKPKAQEEALGLSQHCKAQFITLPQDLQDLSTCSELRCAFQQNLVYWQHPSLPWLSLFPRISAEGSFTGKCTPWAQDASLQQSLMSEWSASLSSLYSLLKARLCPYFYLCSYQFTVLFRAAGLGGSSSITALISPTTRGLREAMKAEGIEFSLPLVEKRSKSSGQQSVNVLQGDEEEQCNELKESGGCCDNDGENDTFDDDDDVDDSISWLKEMGVHDKIKKPESLCIQLHKEGHAVSLDHRPESVVCVEESHTFTLINFLINCKSLVAGAGSQAGLPPTLLAPIAFKGATLHALKARSVNVKSQIGSAYQNISSLEITGPILPSSLHAITTLLQTMQKGNFSAVFYTHTPTAIFNIQTTKEQCGQASVDLPGCGLHPSAVEYLQQPPCLAKTALRHLHMNEYNYTWKT
ncbi:protein downstream neighbor of son homolog [Thalassophryne amazonica]|uniref:protein downstream neighbor of son homolog n=1 Tax=Thalassophryne amazonica TaxID=390379 RepID=UPI0014718AEA|nr:protein downstream neighbor of son homolog [Thalassophryne amazonica]